MATTPSNSSNNWIGWGPFCVRELIALAEVAELASANKVGGPISTAARDGYNVIDMIGIVQLITAPITATTLLTILTRNVIRTVSSLCAVIVSAFYGDLNPKALSVNFGNSVPTATVCCIPLDAIAIQPIPSISIFVTNALMFLANALTRFAARLQAKAPRFVFVEIFECGRKFATAIFAVLSCQRAFVWIFEGVAAIKCYAGLAGASNAKLTLLASMKVTQRLNCATATASFSWLRLHLSHSLLMCFVDLTGFSVGQISKNDGRQQPGNCCESVQVLTINKINSSSTKRIWGLGIEYLKSKYEQKQDTEHAEDVKPFLHNSLRAVDSSWLIVAQSSLKSGVF